MNRKLIMYVKNKALKLKKGERVRINIPKEAHPDTYTYRDRKLKTGMIGIVCGNIDNPQIEISGFKGWKPFIMPKYIQKYSGYND